MRTPNANIERNKLYREVYQNAYSIGELINPSDVDEDASSWEEVDEDKLNHEIHTSIEMSISENQFSSEIQHMAIVEWLDHMPRVKMEDMAFSTHSEAVSEGYWPYKLSYVGASSEIYDMLEREELTLPHSAREEARHIVQQALGDKYDPRVDSPSLTYRKDKLCE